MGFAVVHMQKIKGGAVGGIQSHMNREHESKTNPDIDKDKSKYNYDIIPCNNFNRAIKERINAFVVSKKAIRHDAVVLCNFIITSDNKTMEELGADRRREFFEDSVSWFADRYGAESIVNATVHCDETTDHLHLGIIPITEDGRLSAKAIFTKSELKAIQTEFSRDIGSKYGLERGVENSQNKHLSEIRYKTQKAEEKLAELEKDINAAKGQINGLEGQKMALYGEISNALDTLEVMDSAIKEKNEQGKKLFGSDWVEMIRKGNAEEKENKRDLRLVEFVKEIINEYPVINDLWHRFELEKARKKSRPLAKEELTK